MVMINTNLTHDKVFVCILQSVRERIRTPDLLVRSQTLYPAELRAHFPAFIYGSIIQSHTFATYEIYHTMAVKSRKIK